VIPSAYKSGIALIGDAAHASLTLSSQGVASAIEDARHLTQYLESLSLNQQCTLALWDQACEHFNTHQHPVWQRRQKEARALQRKFMDAELTNIVPVVNT
jgi:2-polyprenyl-6-methoxyphenol hydroxylase-like FAD-dependent oxidoreductase